MSLESGGRADKIGNSYENRYLAKLLLRLTEETYTSIEVEPLGAENDGVEYITTSSDGSRIYYQCKASNGPESKWTFAPLRDLNVFDNARKHVIDSTDHYYHFISPIPYDELDTLCDRARMNHSPHDFVSHQLTNPKLRSYFAKLEEYWSLSRDNPTELTQLVSILSRCYFELVPNSRDYVNDLESYAGRCFIGKSETICYTLENCVHANRWYGKQLTPAQVVDYMAAQGFPYRNYGADSRILPRLQELNTTFWGNYTPINGVLFPRKASDIAIAHLKAGKSVILHGRAGVGKSGCAEEIINSLSNEKIPYLCIKLDKIIPEVSADEFGKKLGLPESPAYCLHKISGENQSVLILDQLDSLRWTAAHSATALAVCKEIINQVKTINQVSNGKVSILFITRTFDYKHDAGIRELFDSNDKTEQLWENIELDILSFEETLAIVGHVYKSMTPRLQKLLRTPANLYVWVQLDPEDRNNNISSVNQLMQKWLDQILRICEQSGLNRSDIEQLISDVATKMNSRSKFSLPKRLFFTKEKEISALISNGLFSENTEVISFTHQSFLDYFLASSAIAKIYTGESIITLLGGRDNQTPNLRYRFLSVLQGLLETDPDLYLEQCQTILESDNIRYYYKCAVFESLAQYLELTADLLAFTKNYLSQSDWHEYVRQTVFYGHADFIKSLAQDPTYEWLSDEGIWLLRSISDNDPDFVTCMLEPYYSDDTVTNQKLFGCLCSDVHIDSSKMYEFRLKLLNRQPSLLSGGCYAFYHSYETAPSRCVDFLKMILIHHDDSLIKSIHLPDEKDLQKFSKANSSMIVSELIPVLFQVTDGMVTKIKEIAYSDEYEKWSDHEYQEGALRKVVEIVKWAMCELIAIEPQRIFAIANQPEYADVLVRNELILSAFQSAPITHADDIIKWMILDFPGHLFDYTSNQVNLLSSAKKVLSIHSPKCSTALFSSLENLICTWHESSKQMVQTYRHRVDVNRRKEWTPVYYTYWGHLQKELLPHLSLDRLSSYSKELMHVLDRNTWIHPDHFHTRGGCSSGGVVVSPVHRYAHGLSDKTWLRIINISHDESRSHFGKYFDDHVVDTSPYAFASDLSSVAEKDPERFAKLALQFPEEVYPGYISAILRVLSKKADASQGVDAELTCNVIRHFQNNNSEETRKEIARIVESRADEVWPEDILELVTRISLLSQKPFPSQNDEKPLARKLHTAILNQPRGCALIAISKLLWNHSELLDYFKPILVDASNDESDSVRFAAIGCIAQYYNAEPEFCLSTFRHILALDSRSLISQFAWHLIYKDFVNNPEFYRDQLCAACKSEMTDLSEHAASYICALSIYYNDLELQNYILTANHNASAVTGIVHQAAYSFDDEEYNEISATILLNIVNRYECEMGSFRHNFFRDKIILSRDQAFLISLLQSKSKLGLMPDFLKYLRDVDENISAFADLLKILSAELPNEQETYKQRKMVKDLIQCVIRLFDRGKDDPHIRCVCLDIWDDMFKSNLQDIRPLAVLIDNFD